MAHTTHSTPSPPHSRQVHETSTTSLVHLSALRRHLVILSTGQYTGNSSSNPTSSSARDGDGADSGSEPASPSSRLDLDWLRLLPERLVDI